jgi:hypothetical protein
MKAPLQPDPPNADRPAGNQPASEASVKLPPSTQQSLFEAPHVDVGEAEDVSTERLVMRSVYSLKPPPAVLRHGLLVPLELLLTLEKLGDFLLEKTILITQDDLIIDGSEFWQIAKRQGRAKLLCRVCQASEEEALLLFLQYQRRPVWLNGFSRVRLVLDLEPWLCKRALANQIAGGEGKALAKLPEAEKVNCREELAKLSGECAKNVDKVRKILADSIPQLIAAAQSGEVSIHHAWKLSSSTPADQQAALASQRSKKRSQRTLRELRRNVENNSVKICLRELMPILTRMQAIPDLCAVWERIADLFAAINHQLTEERSNPSEQA